jgi:UDP-N-acetylglucosamine 2-epimerase (non-hydrolysing)
MNIDLVVGCRPNFVKAAAIVHAAKLFPRLCNIRMLHTGQHDTEISAPYFRDLELPDPYLYFGGLGQLYDAVRLGKMTADLGNFWNGQLDKDRPDYVMVVGDTDSTLAGALAAKKQGLPLVHVEAGLRCYDPKMQEEINRELVDSVSDVLYTTTEHARENLIAEHKSPFDVVTVGNVMADTLKRFLPKAVQTYPTRRPDYGILTIHRAENVYNQDRMAEIVDGVRQVADTVMPIIFPMHPRQHVRLWGANLERVAPMGYLEFIATMARAEFVITDSGGVQEETTILGVPCITIRDNTERPETVKGGTNIVVGTDGGAILKAVQDRHERINDLLAPPLWDGKAAERIIKDLLERKCGA